MRKKKIGEILVDSGLITKEILGNALAHQEKFGGSVTQYLTTNKFISEEDLAKCISIQFGYPYLPLRAYDIPESVVRLIPANMAREYILMPVDKIENIITVVMSDPFDYDGIKAVEDTTGCRVQPFVGIISDIMDAIEKYYAVSGEHLEPKKSVKKTPLFMGDSGYAGVERRKSVRINANIEVHFPLQDEYKKAKIKNVSMNGFLFESSNILPVNSYLMLEVDLPKEVNEYPLVGVVQVVRVVPLSNRKFDIGVKLVDMPRDNIDKIVKYALDVSQPKNA